MSAGTVDEISAHVKDTYVKSLHVEEDTSVMTERLRSSRCALGVRAGAYFRFTPSGTAVCYGCGSEVPEPVAATQPAFLPRGFFVAFCSECVKTPTT